VKAPRIVFVHHMRQQFCWSGVTGMIAAFKGGFVAIAGEMAARRSLCKRPDWQRRALC
jgi:hypothetical protein